MSVSEHVDTGATLADARRRTLDLVAHLSPEDCERVVDPLMSPLAWDLAHVAAYEDLWLGHRHGGLPLLHAERAAMYDAFETPRAVRGHLPLLGYGEALAYLDDVRERVDEVLDRRGPGDGVLVELVLRHELQHTETMRQAMALGGLLPDGEPPALEPAAQGGWRRLPAGRFEMGTPDDAGFAYDNERPAHRVRVEAHAIARRPVSNAEWLAWRDSGGYERPGWWTPEGWTWLERQKRRDRSTATTGAPGAPVCHVSWYEADAFARAAGARLPTEAEWERAARLGVLDGAGAVWEWTSSPFTGYPGFRAHPYREYSEPFFGDAHRVLRGGSWATHPRVAGPAFRNWDLPERRQIFAGLRLAADAT